jgi:uncharacterized protein
LDFSNFVKGDNFMNIIDEKLEKLLDLIKIRFSPDKIILFGSRAKNAFTEDSDYDLCILKNEIESKRKLTKEIYKSLIGSFMAVDIIVEKTSEYEKLKNNPYLIYNDIEKYGKVLYGK